jgi:gamma-glutamyltranspeptidase/glutathione hydrolase
MKMNKTILLILLSVIIMEAQDRPAGKNFATRSEVIAQNGIAATSQPLATMVAIDILKNGGNAIDAAIAANAMLGLVEPMSCGIGGDLFVILWDAKSKKLHGLNASGRSPKSLTLKMLKDMKLDKIPIRGALPVSVPGCVDGWFELHSKFGKLPMKEILKPTIQYAREGFPVSEIIANAWKGSVKSLADSPGFLECFFNRWQSSVERGNISKTMDYQKHLRGLPKMAVMNFIKVKQQNE